ncbi:MAG: hypothetical protein ACRDKV_06040 [Solirubrobacterales bacterium]
MEAAVASGVRASYTGLALRTRARRHQGAACHTPGCRHQVSGGKRFCKSCQQTLDRVREELMSAKPRGRKPAVRKPAVRKAA